MGEVKVALVYDRVNRLGGAERVLEALHQLWPEAPLYTAVYDSQGAPWADKFQVKPSFLQRLPLAGRHHEYFGWLTPVAFESFNFNSFDLVVSVSSAEAKGVITRPETTHVCYCLTPTRYLWSDTWAHFRRYPFKSRLLEPVVRSAGSAFSTPLRVWDQVAAQRPDHYLTISQVVKERIKRYYQREATVVYPPVDVGQYRPLRSKGRAEKKVADRLPATKYDLIVSRLVPYKRVDLAVEAFNRLGSPLVVVGQGPEEKRLRKMAKANIIFTGQLTQARLINYYQGCQALILPQEEDFGLVAVEAQAAGRPVIAYRGGGALETVSEGKTGLFFNPQTAAALIEAIRAARSRKFLAQDCLSNAKRFNQQHFERNFKREINRILAKRSG